MLEIFDKHGDILFKDKLLEEWVLSSLVPIFNPNLYRGIKLLEHAFKLYEKVLENAFDWVPNWVSKVGFALRQKFVREYLVDGVMSLYKDFKTAFLFGIRNVRGGFIVVLMCLGRRVYYHVGCLFL